MIDVATMFVSSDIARFMVCVTLMMEFMIGLLRGAIIIACMVMIKMADTISA
jgi:hypothetical protein